MDGLDVYIDDYSKPDPLPEGWLGKMKQMARLGDFEEKPEDDPEKPARRPRSSPTASLRVTEKPSTRTRSCRASLKRYIRYCRMAENRHPPVPE